MLVCPHCQFENPDTNKFCQSCGDALTDEIDVSDLPNVSEDVLDVPTDRSQLMQLDPSIAETSDKGCVRLAILSPLGQQTLETGSLQRPSVSTLTNAQPEVAQPEVAQPEIAQPELVQPEQTRFSTELNPSDAFLPSNGQYLDSTQRYQLLQSLPQIHPPPQAFEVQVLDTRPFAASHLQGLYQPTSDEPDATLTLASIPLDARLYLELQQHYPSLPLPELHDAWEQDGYSITLLKDRSNLPLLVDVCQDETILPLQILYWLYEMVEHWAVLQPQQQCQSLLKLDNLRIDPEDDVLCLRRLYADAPQDLPTLAALGAVWQTLFEQSQRTQHGDLFLLCRDLEAGTLSSVEELRSRIEEIAHQLQQLTESSTPLPMEVADGAIYLEAFEKNLVNDEDDEDVSADDLQFAELNEAIANENDDQPTVILPMQLISIEDAGRTITGRQRDHNEDSFYIQTHVRRTETKRQDDSQDRTVHAKGLYILCDGMGGHAGGEVASALAVDTLRQYFEVNWQDSLPNEQSIREAIYLANQAIYDQNQDHSRMGSGRMGTTLVLVLLQNADIAVAHVGDSRLYRLSRRRGLEQVTVDHEVGQREIQRGVEPTIAYARPDAYQLTQALGPRDEGFINPDVSFFELNEDTLLLLCSDGITDNDLLEIHEQTRLTPLLDVQINLEQGLNDLIEFANQFNGHDNITAIAIRVRVRPNLSQTGNS